MLFPEQPATPSAGLVGIAKLAAASGLLLSKRSVEYRSLPVRSYIGRCSNPELPFEWTLNPYRGCEYGCKYCYARYSHEFMELRDGDDFETHIFAKEWNRAAFASELRHIPYGHTVAIGTVTDPYQPAERRFGITGQMLEVFRDNSTHRRLWMTTKSDLVARDAALLAEIAGRDNEVSVNVTITTLDAGLARELEPFAPRPDLRLDAVRELARAGVKVRVNCSPLMPLINDSEENIDAVARAARQAGATGFWSNAVFLKPCAKAVFFPYLEEHYPHLVRRYRQHFQNSAYLKGPYVETIEERVQGIKARHGFPSRSESRKGPQGSVPQLSFQWDAS
jgi:DNA repair photolyase